MGGFKSRLNRHLRDNKRPQWHIDYLLEKAHLDSIIIAEVKEKIECRIAAELSRQLEAVPGFGSSDCRCRSHLFLAARKGKIESALKSVFASLAVQPIMLATA